MVGRYRRLGDLDARVGRLRAGGVMVTMLALLLALAVSGCGATNTGRSGDGTEGSTSATSGQAVEVDRSVPPVLLRNPAPDGLDVRMSLTFDQQGGDNQLMVEVGLSFMSGDKMVQFSGDERVTCGGTAFPLKQRAAVLQVMRAPAADVAGTTVRCEYAAGGVTADVALPVPPAPTITAPRNGEQVARSKQTLVTYRADLPSITMSGVVALAPGSQSPKALATPTAPGQASADTSGFAAGAGTLALSVYFTPHIAQSGSPFHSVEATGSALVMVSVTWV